MTMLLFRDGRYDVATTAWTASAKNGGSVDIAYVWGADRISFIDSATGVCRISFNISMDEFLAYKRGDVIDLRPNQR